MSSVVGVRSPTATGSRELSQLAEFKRREATRAAIQTRGDSIQFRHDRMQLELKALAQEIKTDEEAAEAYTRQLAKLEARKADLRKVIAQQEEFTVQFDREIGPFERKYEDLQHSVDGVHRHAKAKYDQAVKLLVDKLGYHPAFKRHNDLI